MLTGQWYQRPLPSLDNVQHSAGLALYPGGGEFGRAKGSGCWDGAFKTVFWIDPVTGIAVSVHMNKRAVEADRIIRPNAILV